VPRMLAFQHGLAFADTSRGNFANVWRSTLLTASFQNLSADATKHHFRYHPMPWGADQMHFAPPANASAMPRDFILLVGDEADSESHGEILFAASHAGLRVRHVGATEDKLCGQCVMPESENYTLSLLCKPVHELGGKKPCDFHENLGRVSDETLLRMYQQARYVPALRKFEGFEMTAVEALFCGTRPIVYDISTYVWYKGHASFVGSGIPGDQLFLQLVDIMRRPPKPVSATELAVLHSTFSWQAIVPRLFDILEDARREADANSTLADLPPLYPIGWANSQSLRQGSRHKRSSWFSLGGSDDEQEPTSVNLQLPATL